MTRTPDETKKGLELCSVGFYENACTDCPYSSLVMAECPTKLKADALTLIQQLQAENAKKDETIQMLQGGNASLMRMIDEECEKTVKLEAERDAALADFKLYRERNINGECGVYACDLCKLGGKYEEWEGFKCPKGCMGIENWEWRGVQKEE